MECNRNNFGISKMVNIPVSLYESMLGQYFVGYADRLVYTGKDISAWGSLYNPPDSGVNLHVNVWTVTSLFGVFRAEVWFNANMPGRPQLSEFVTAANNAVYPIPKPKVYLLQASNVLGEPVNGMKAFVRRGEAQSTIVAEEDGKFIFPPGGSFSVFLSNPETPDERAEGRVAFGWWEEPIC